MGINPIITLGLGKNSKLITAGYGKLVIYKAVTKDKQVGVKFTFCPKCGEVIVGDVRNPKISNWSSKDFYISTDPVLHKKFVKCSNCHEILAVMEEDEREADIRTSFWGNW